MRRATRGFTLVEIMIVVAVVGVGAGIALVNMSDQVAEARAQADGDAMAQRIQVEQRAARERMVGLRLTKNPSGQLDFEDVTDCKRTSGSNLRHHKHLSTTKLDISTGDDTVCWDRNGQLVAVPVTATAGMTSPVAPKGGVDDPVELQVRAGLKRVRVRKLRTTLAGPIAAAIDGTAVVPND